MINSYPNPYPGKLVLLNIYVWFSPENLVNNRKFIRKLHPRLAVKIKGKRKKHLKMFHLSQDVLTIWFQSGVDDEGHRCFAPQWIFMQTWTFNRGGRVERSFAIDQPQNRTEPESQSAAEAEIRKYRCEKNKTSALRRNISRGGRSKSGISGNTILASSRIIIKLLKSTFS